MRQALDDLVRTSRRDPAFALYLLALAALGLKWLSPLESIYDHAIWSDLLIAASAVAWAWERARAGSRPRIRTFHVAMALYVAAGALATAFAIDHGTSAANLLLMVELCILALLTSEFASDQARLNAIVLVITLVALYTGVLAVVGLGRVGLPLALSFADRGIDVLGVEREPAVLEQIAAGRMPFRES